MSIAKVIESIEREMFERAAREESAEIVDVTNLEDDTEKERRYIKGRRNDCETEA